MLLLLILVFSLGPLNSLSSGAPSYSCIVSNWTLTLSDEQDPIFGTCHYFSSRANAGSPDGRSCRRASGPWALLPAHRGDPYLIASAMMVRTRVTGGSIVLTHASADYVPESSMVEILRSASLAGGAAPLLALASLFGPGEECLVVESLIIGAPEYYPIFQQKLWASWKVFQKILTDFLWTQYRGERELESPGAPPVTLQKFSGCLDHRNIAFMNENYNRSDIESSNGSIGTFQSPKNNTLPGLEGLVSTHFPSARFCGAQCYGELYQAGTILFRISRQLPSFLLFVSNPFFIMIDWNVHYPSVGVQALLSILGHKFTHKLTDWSTRQVTSVINAVKHHHAACSHPYNQTIVRFTPSGQKSTLPSRARVLALVHNSSVNLDRLVSPPLCSESESVCRISNACVEANSEMLYNGICLESPWPPKQPLSKLVKSPLETTARSPPPFIEHPPPILPVHVNRQVFVDDFLVDWEASSQVERMWFQAELVAEMESPSCGHTGYSSAIEGPSTGIVYLYTTFGIGKLFRFTFSLTAAKVLKKQVVPGLPPEIEVTAVIDRGQWAGDCRYVLGLTTISDRKHGTGEQYLRVYCSSDGLAFSFRSTPGLVEDGHSMFYNRFRNVSAILIRANPFLIRMQRYAEFPRNGTLPDNVWKSIPTRNRNGPVLEPQQCALVPNDTSCGDPALNLAWSDIRATPDDLHFRRHWDDEVTGFMSAAKRITDVYYAHTSQYHSLMITVAAFHYAGVTTAKLIYPALLFSRDGFRHTGAGWLTRHGMLADYKPGYGLCQVLPSSRVGDSRNQNSALYIFCTNARRYDGLKTCSSLYSIRSDGFAAVVPSGPDRGDFWTRWLSVPFPIGSLFVSARLTGNSELTPCFYPLNDQGDSAFCFRTALSPSTSPEPSLKNTSALDYLEFKVPETHNLSVVPQFFRLRFRMRGVVRLFSFWFDKTVWI